MTKAVATRPGVEKFGRTLTVPVPFRFEVEVSEENGRHTALTREWETVIATTATTRPGAIARLERLVETTLAKLLREREATG